jgi:hypothetical protein
MNKSEDFAYYQARALQERSLGSQCEDNAVALVHLRMADEYERRIAGMAEQWPDNRLRSRA